MSTRSIACGRVAALAATLLMFGTAHAVTDTDITIKELTVYKSGRVFAVFTNEALSGCGAASNQYQFSVGSNELTDAGFALAFAALSAAVTSGAPVTINHDAGNGCFGRTVTVSGRAGTNGVVAPGAIVELATTTAIAPGQSGDLRRTNTNGISAGDYTVPDGKVLVLQSLQLYPETLGAGRLNVQLVQNALVRSFWVLPQNSPTLISTQPGLVIAPGFSLDIANGAVSATSVRAIAYGYLTDAE